MSDARVQERTAMARLTELLRGRDDERTLVAAVIALLPGGAALVQTAMANVSPAALRAAAREFERRAQELERVAEPAEDARMWWKDRD